jgi:hypothetical protein
VGEGDPPDPVRQPLKVVLPAVLGRQVDLRVAVELVDDQLHDAVEEVVTAGDVPVQRHPLDAQVRAHPAHREGLEPVLVDELDGRGEHPPAVERGPDRPGRCGPDRTGVGGPVTGHSTRRIGVVHHPARLPSSRSTPLYADRAGTRTPRCPPSRGERFPRPGRGVFTP